VPTILIVFLAVVAAYVVLGTPIMNYIHNFVQQFVHSFPALVFFLPDRARRTGLPQNRPQVRRP